MMPTRIVLVLASLLSSAAIHSQTPVAVACSQVKGVYQCDKAAFVKTLSTIRTVAIETQPYDRNGERELSELAQHLGKTVVTTNPGLVFRLEKLDPDSAIFYGPNDRELAALRIYTFGSPGRHGPLIWVETFHGQPDTPWPTVVYDIIQQLKADTQ